MPDSCILVDKSEGICTITLNRQSVLNALNDELLRELRDALREADGDAEVGVVILTGAGRAFSAGVDLKFRGSEGQTPDTRANFKALARETLATIEGLSKPVIAAVHGYAVTGALELVLTCDLIVASEEAKFGDTHAKFGMTPHWGGSQRLPRLIGAIKARELIFTSQLISAGEAERIGLVNQVVPSGTVVEAARQLAVKILANSRDSVRILKRLINDGLKLEMEEALCLEDTLTEPIPDHLERVKSFTGRR
ncbi:MAG: enoyl-CoA hydratase/isomerase family protein [Dehalococcoidia bacterium]|nr:enoyl-CoA hydratase/isomerase family protein [Dehalococcoidia bacterium]